MRWLAHEALGVLHQFMRLDGLDEEYADGVSGVTKEAFVVFLDLKDVQHICAAIRVHHPRNVQDLILPLLLVIGWVGNFVVKIVSRVVQLQVAKLGEGVLVADTIESDTAKLNADRTLTRSTRVELLEPVHVNLELLLSLFTVLAALICLLLRQLGDFEGPQNSSNRRC